MKRGVLIVYFFAGILCCEMLYAQDPAGQRKKVKSTISVAAIKSIYKNHPQHTINTKSKPGFNASYKLEFLTTRRTSVLFGLDYLSQGFTFKGYYVGPGFTYLFDKTYAYTHEIRAQELHIPIGFKNLMNLEKDNFYTPYYYAGAGLRYIINSYYVISNDSTETVVYDGKGNLNFEHQVFTKIANKLLDGKGSSFTQKLNSYLYAGFGIQRNLRESGKAICFDLCYKFGISRMHYNGYNNSNNLNIKDSHLLFNVGLKF
ncbi:MAG: outer membrane beta-barrel protein [Bacteroidia bacterium]